MIWKSQRAHKKHTTRGVSKAHRSPRRWRLKSAQEPAPLDQNFKCFLFIEIWDFFSRFGGFWGDDMKATF